MQFRSTSCIAAYDSPWEIEFTVLVAISPRQAINPLEVMKTKGNGAADCSNSIGNPNSNLLGAEKAQPSLCVHVKAAAAQSSTSGIFVMRKVFISLVLHESTFLPPHLHHPLTKNTAADLLI